MYDGKNAKYDATGKKDEFMHTQIKIPEEKGWTNGRDRYWYLHG